MKKNDIVGYTLRGRGSEKVIIIHDWLGDHTNYDGLLPYLDYETFSYAFIDLRGYGKSMHTPGQYTAKESSTDAIHLADHLQWDRFHLVGHSMSGMIVQRIALDAKNRIKSVVAISPVPACGIPFPPQDWDFFMSTADNDQNLKELVNQITGKRLSQQWLNFKLKQNRETSLKKARQDYLIMWSKTNFADQVAGLKTPFRVIVGEYDHEAFREEAMKKTFLTWYPNAELMLCKNAGHYSMEETPVYIATLIEDFIFSSRRL